MNLNVSPKQISSHIKVGTYILIHTSFLPGKCPFRKKSQQLISMKNNLISQHFGLRKIQKINNTHMINRALFFIFCPYNINMMASIVLFVSMTTDIYITTQCQYSFSSNRYDCTHTLVSSAFNTGLS